MDDRWQDSRPMTERDETHRRNDAPASNESQDTRNARSDRTAEIRPIVSDPIGDLQTALAQVSQISKRIKMRDSDQYKRIKKLESDLDIQQTANNALLQETQALTQNLKKLQEDFKKLQTEHNASEACVASLMKEREQLQADLTAAKTLAHLAKSENHKLQLELMETEQVNETLRYESSRHQRQIAHTTDTITAFKAIIQQLEESSDSEDMPPLSDDNSDSFESWLDRKIRKETVAS